MTKLQCPVCGTIIDVEATTLCNVCGFENHIFATVLPKELDIIEKQRIEIAKTNYNIFTNCKSENEQLHSKITELNKKLTQLNQELDVYKGKEEKIPYYLMQDDTLTGRHKLHPLKPGIHSFGGDVAAKELSCDYHHTIDSNTPPTQFIIKATIDEKGKYTFTATRYATAPLLIDNNEVSNELKINPGKERLSLGTYRFQLLKL